MCTWLTFVEACEHLKVCADTLRLRMRTSDTANLERVWTERPIRFRAELIDDWNWGVCEWLRSESTEASGKSDGATPTAAPGAASAPRSALPKRSGKKSTRATRSGGDGSFLMLLKSRTSRTA